MTKTGRDWYQWGMMRNFLMSELWSYPMYSNEYISLLDKVMKIINEDGNW